MRKLLLTGVCAIALATPFAANSQDADLVETAQQAGNFSIALEALETAGLVETLKGEGPFTVFAPNDEAFENLQPEGVVDGLLEEENREELITVLEYHVAPGVVTPELVAGAQVAIETVLGQPILVIGTPNGMVVNGVNVIESGIQASNGVIHVINGVLLPQVDEEETAEASGG